MNSRDVGGMARKQASGGTLMLTAMLVSVCGLGVEALARTPGTISKFSQPLGLMDPVPGAPPMYLGANHGSDFDWRFLMNPTDPTPRWVVADDFPSQPGVSINTIRWYGSYFQPFLAPQPSPTGGPLTTTEDGWVFSFHRDLQPTPGGPNFSQPRELVGTYVATPEIVRYSNTGIKGWDGHEVWCYEVDLKDLCLAHGTPGEAEPGRFIQRQTENNIYWLSIAAENGHDIIPGSNPSLWTSVPNDDQPITFGHFWGWHASPQNFMDLPVMGNVFMPNSQQWVYGPWQPVLDQHQGRGMAFELLTVPAPTSAALMGLGVLMLGRRRR